MESKRLSMLNQHFEQKQTLNTSSNQGPADDDVVVVACTRTALTRAKKGAQRNTAPEQMLAPIMREVVKKAKIDPKELGGICIGNVLQSGAGVGTSRMAQFMAGIPDTVPLYTINRMCSSGLQAVMDVANSIRAGQFDIGMGGGVESMTKFNM